MSTSSTSRRRTSARACAGTTLRDVSENPDKTTPAAGKSASGTIELNAYHKGGSIHIEVADDGLDLASYAQRPPGDQTRVVEAASRFR